METVTDFIFLGFKITADSDCSHEIKMLAPWKKSFDQPRQHIKKQKHYFTDKGLSSQSYGFSSSHVWMWELNHKETWVPKNGCFWSVVLEKTLESPWDCQEIQPVHPKGNQSWIFTGRTDAEAEAPILWPPNAKNWLIGKDPDAGKDWRQEKGTTGWDGWMASPKRWTRIWSSSGSWWWTGKSGMLQSMGVAKSQTQLSKWTKYNCTKYLPDYFNLQTLLLYLLSVRYCLGLQLLAPKSLTQFYDLSIISIIP